MLTACKKNNVGTTAMKTAPGSVKIDPLDPDTFRALGQVHSRQVEAGEKREDVVKDIQDYIAESEKRFRRGQAVHGEARHHGSRGPAHGRGPVGAVESGDADDV